MFPHGTKWHRDINQVQNRLLINYGGDTTEFVSNDACIESDFIEWPEVRVDAPVHKIPKYWLGLMACGEYCITHRIPNLEKRVVFILVGFPIRLYTIM